MAGAGPGAPWGTDAGRRRQGEEWVRDEEKTASRAHGAEDERPAERTTNQSLFAFGFGFSLRVSLAFGL